MPQVITNSSTIHDACVVYLPSDGPPATQDLPRQAIHQKERKAPDRTISPLTAVHDEPGSSSGSPCLISCACHYRQHSPAAATTTTSSAPSCPEVRTRLEGGRGMPSHEHHPVPANVKHCPTGRENVVSRYLSCGMFLYHDTVEVAQEWRLLGDSSVAGRKTPTVPFVTRAHESEYG